MPAQVVGLAACDIRQCLEIKDWSRTPPKAVPGRDFCGNCFNDVNDCPLLVDAIKNRPTFEGVSGTVDIDATTGSRVGSSANYVLKNMRAFTEEGMDFRFAGIWDPVNKWTLAGDQRQDDEIELSQSPRGNSY